jgi:hypothetical protein
MLQAQTRPIPPMADRLQALRRSSWPERVALHEAIAARKAEAIEARRALGRRYLEQHPGGCVIPPEQGFAALDLEAETRGAREEAVALAEGRAAQANNGSLEFPVLAHDFAADSDAIRFGVSPLVLAPIVRYFGLLPILFNMFVTRAHTTELLTNSPHLFHLDPEDVISFKVFIHLTDVDDDCGPFHAMRADTTQTVLAAVDYRGVARIPDEQVEALVGWEPVMKFLGPAGTVALADTTRCLHFGGRPRKAGKPVRDMLVYQYLAPTSLLLPVDGDGEQRNFFPHLAPSGDEHWDALIGARYA